MTRATADISESTIWKKIAASCLLACALLFVWMPQAASAQDTFNVQSVPNQWTAVFTDANGRSVTVRMDPQSPFCTAINSAGYAASFARSSVADCDRTIVIEFETNGFLIQAITLADIDDVDGTAPRDGLAMNVAGTWTSPTIEVHSFASPPTYADQAARLTAAGAVGSFLSNISGDNPVDETATFTMTVPTTIFELLHDDLEGGRNARFDFDLDNMVIVSAVGSILTVTDSATVASSSGGTNVLNVYDGDTLNGVTATTTNTIVSLASGSTLPTGFTFDTATGEVSVAAGTPVGQYSFDYQICEIGFPTNCETETATVTVTGTLDLSISKSNGVIEVTSGTTTTYTTTVSHNGGDPVVGAVVTDIPGSGINCDAGATVTITGDGVPSGSFTFADLSGGGITLGTLTSGQSTTLTYTCQVN